MLWTLAAALLYILCFPGWNLFFLAPAAFFCFYLALPHLKEWRHAAKLALVASFIIGIGGFHWIVYVGQNFGQLPYPFAVLMLLGFCIIAAPQLVTFYILSTYFQQKTHKIFAPLLPLLYSCLYVALEFLFSFVKVFPENIGNPQIQWLNLAQVASIGGVSLLSFLVIYPGFSSAAFFQTKSKSSLSHLLCSLLLLVTAHFWGAGEIQRLDHKAMKEVKFSVIQANIGDLEKVLSEAGNSNGISTIINSYLEMTRQSPADLVIWPETAYPMNYPSSPAARSSSLSRAYASIMQDTMKKMHSALLFGGYEQIEQDTFNSAIFMDTNGTVQQSYRKKNLLLFGEYMPLAGVFPALKQLNPQMGDFAEGPGAVPLVWEKEKGGRVALAVNICYEAIMPEYMRQFVKNGAQVFLNITNDSWFGPGLEPYQHLQLALLRTIENRTPMIRATNTGISVAVDIVGRMQKQSPLFKPYALTDTVRYLEAPERSYYTAHGSVFALLCILLSLLFLVVPLVL